MSQALEMPAPVEVKGGVVAYLAIDGALKAAALYEEALGATIASTMPADDKGRCMHAHLYVNGQSLMLGDFFPEQGFSPVAPAAFNLMLMVDDVDAWFKRATAAGFDTITAPTTMFWGDYYAMMKDPFGVTWALNQGPK
jgi:PhnB protein